MGSKSSPRQYTRADKKSRTLRNLGVVITLAVVCIVGYYALQGSGSAGPATIIPPGITIQLQPSSYTYYEDTFPSPVQISGSFSTSYSVLLYIMTPSQFAEFNSSSGLRQFVATFSASKGQSSPTSVNWDLRAGQYYFVISDPWSNQSTFTTGDGIEAVS